VLISINNIPDTPPVVQGSTFSVDENSPVDTFVGQLNINDYGSPITSIILSGQGSENFKAYNNGTVVVAEGASLDYETVKLYTLNTVAYNEYGASNNVSIRININNVPDVPPVVQGSTFSVNENSLSDTFVGQLNINDYGSPITSIILSGQGSENFKAYNNGTIVVAEGASLDYETVKLYTLNTVAYNEYGASNNVSVRININNVPDVPPVVQSSTFYVNENSPSETLVGRLNINDNGSPITSIVLSGYGAENFKAYNNGTIVVAENANIDYETVYYYYFNIIAYNEFGASNSVSTIIRVNDLPDSPPYVHHSSFYIDENSPSGTFTGKVAIDENGAPVSSIGFEGEGSENFNIALDGTISVAEGANLDYETKEYYTLMIFADNVYGRSSGTRTYIYLNNVPDSPPSISDIVIHLDKNALSEDLLYRVKINNDGSEVEDIYLYGADSENFDIELTSNSTADLKVSSTANLESFDNGTHKIYINALNRFGSGNATVWLIVEGGSMISPPSFNNITFVTFGQSIQSGSIIGHIEPSSKIHCQISEYFTNNAKFALNNENELTAVHTIHSSEIHNLTIQANSSCGMSNKAFVTVDTKNIIKSSFFTVENVNINSDNFVFRYLPLELILTNNSEKILKLNGDSLYIANLTNPANGYYANLTNGSDTHILSLVAITNDDRYLYTISSSSETANSSLRVYDIREISSPSLISTTALDGFNPKDPEGWSVINAKISKDNSKIFLQDMNGIHTINVSNPYTPSVLSKIGLSYGYTAVISEDDKSIYVMHGEKGVVIRYYVNDPENPVQLSSIKLSGIKAILGTSEDGAYVYIYSDNYGIVAYSMEDTANPKLLSTYDVSGFEYYSYYARLMNIGEGKMLSDTAYFNIFDFNNPGKPYISVTTSSSAYRYFGDYFKLSSDKTKVFARELFSGEIYMSDLFGIDIKNIGK
jgi:hypothetical protein